jgi:hypothetical protein
MRVTDWQKWTSFKKKVAFTLVGIGIFLSFGMETTMMWGVLALGVAFTGVCVSFTIQEGEW